MRGMRLTTYVVLLAALVAVPAARVGGLLGGGPAIHATPAAAQPLRRDAAPPAATPIPTTVPSTTTPTVAPPPNFLPTVNLVPTLVWTTADVHPSGVEVYSNPTDAVPSLDVSGFTEFNTPRVLPVIGQQAGWLEVRLPVRPNNDVGWIRSADVTLSAVSDKILVSLVDRQLTWYHGQTLELQTTVGIGSVNSPTPAGEYYITDVLPSSGAYGPFILALNGHSDTYTDFEGGDARLAIHGTDDPTTIGAAASHGCVHVANNLDTYLASIIKPGTLVEIG
jgi:hypothetical protein